MTTAQLAGKERVDLYWEHPQPGFRRIRAREAAGAKDAETACPGGPFTYIVPAVVQKMEKGDTLTDRLVAYGLCCLSAVYLAAQIIRAAL
jgi:hypothetical protein